MFREWLGRESHRQPFSSLGSSLFQNLYAPGCAHSRPEAVGACPSQIAWLIRPFHGGLYPLLSQIKRKLFTKQNILSLSSLLIWRAAVILDTYYVFCYEPLVEHYR